MQGRTNPDQHGEQRPQEDGRQSGGLAARLVNHEPEPRDPSSSLVLSSLELSDTPIYEP